MVYKKYVAVFIVAFILLASYLHYSTLKEEHALHGIYSELHYIPLILAALVFGLKGSILSYLLISILYFPFIVTTWTDYLLVDKVLHLIFAGGIALSSGFLVDRERKVRDKAENSRRLACIGQVATVIVHDLKNPLLAILGFAKRIRARKGDIDTAADTIIGAAEEMQQIVYDVLDFSKPVNLALKEEDLKTVIMRACNACRIKAENAGIDLSVELPENQINAPVDSFYIERALVNLINNAIEASVKGQNVAVSLAQGKEHAVVRIKDNGTGMDKSTIENTFTPFYTTKKGGTGLGMAIAKKIIEGHNGEIAIESQQGKGTEIRIEVPLKSDLKSKHYAVRNGVLCC